MLIFKHIELVPIYVHSAIQRFVNSAHNEFSFTEEAYKNINHTFAKGYLFVYLDTVRPSLLCIEINLSPKTKNISPIKSAITKQLVYSKSFNYFVWEELWTI